MDPSVYNRAIGRSSLGVRNASSEEFYVISRAIKIGTTTSVKDICITDNLLQVSSETKV